MRLLFTALCASNMPERDAWRIHGQVISLSKDRPTVLGSPIRQLRHCGAPLLKDFGFANPSSGLPVQS